MVFMKDMDWECPTKHLQFPGCKQGTWFIGQSICTLTLHELQSSFNENNSIVQLFML
jgi:hypothetical protein